MGDIIGIADSAGNLIVSYTYDALGKVMTVTGSNTALGELNPFRYRSYYYDGDIQMYYLQSRYYDPEIGRFINTDDVNYLGVTESELSYNAFAYCDNNPVNDIDPFGRMRVSYLNKIAQLFYNKKINITDMATIVFILNRLNIYTAFHEIAQILMYNKLSGKKYTVALEKSLGKLGEIDVAAYKDPWYECIWEVKPLDGVTPEEQLQKYTNGTGFYRGFYMSSIKSKLYENLIIKVSFDDRGGAFYSFYNSREKRVTNADLYSKVRTQMIKFYSVSGILVASLLASVVLSVYSGGAAAPVIVSITGNFAASLSSKLAA